MDPESVHFMAREIHVLRRLDHPNIIKLEGMITSPSSSSLQLIFEYMELDLAGLSASPGIKFTEAQVKCYMKQLLLGLENCHSRRILHRDIKGSNLFMAHTSKNNSCVSGPLLVNGGDIEEILRAHERQIQQVVRRAHTDKAQSQESLQ